MKRLLLCGACLCALMLTSCKMPDGPMPDPKASETANRIGDLAKDLGNVAAGHEEARTDFLEDLMAFVDVGDKPDAAAPVKELGNQLMTAYTAAKASERAVVPLLEQVAIGISATSLSENQVQTVKDDLRKAATDLGVDDVHARALASQIEIVQQSVTERHRRWYEVF